MVHDLVNVYDWIMLPASVGEKFFRNGTIDLSKFPCHQLNGSFCALSAMRKSVQWYCQGCFDENADYEGVVCVVRRRSKSEAQRKWVTASNGKQKLDNYFNRQFTATSAPRMATWRMMMSMWVSRTCPRSGFGMFRMTPPR